MSKIDKKKKKLTNIAKGKGVSFGRSGSKYMTEGKYKLDGGRLYTGRTYSSRGSALPIDDIPSNTHLSHRTVASYVKGLSGNYGGYMWNGEVMTISGSGPSYTTTSQGKA